MPTREILSNDEGVDDLDWDFLTKKANLEFVATGCIFNFYGASETKRHKGITLSVCLSVRLSNLLQIHLIDWGHT